MIYMYPILNTHQFMIGSNWPFVVYLIAGKVVPTGTPSNPCTPHNLALGIYYFEYPGNDQLYIECYNLPYVAIVKSCDVHHYWSQKYLTCLYRQVAGWYNFSCNKIYNEWSITSNHELTCVQYKIHVYHDL
jgi:hypothetical protein